MIVSGNNVYVVWEDDSNGGDSDILFTVSNDNGQTFVDPPTDLSKNAGLSETPQMIFSGNSVYVVWADDSNGGDRDIFFTVSNNNGQTFVDPPIDLSKNAEGSFGQQMIVSGNNVYVVWSDDSNGVVVSNIFFTVSNDNGQTFVDPPIDLSNNPGGTGHQQMIVSGNNVYVVWVNSGNDDDIFFTVSNDNGQTFVDPPTDLSKNDGNSENPQMIVQ
jgi:hypothetical protein